MARDTQGNYSLPLGTLVKAGDTVLVSQHNPAMQDIASALTKSLARDGRGGMQAALKMGGFKITGLAPGVDPTDAATVAQIGATAMPDGVYLSSYPGTTDNPALPAYLDNDNAKWAAAAADITNPLSPNFGKILYLDRNGSALEQHIVVPDEDPVTGEPVPAYAIPPVGSYMLDDWSQNGAVIQETPTVIYEDVGNLPGKLRSGMRVHLLPGAGVMRPPRAILRPLMICGDPNRVETDPDAIDTQEDVYQNVEIVCHGNAAFYGENYRYGFREHFNDISINGGSDVRVITRHFGPMSDALYCGAGNVGGGLWNRHNKRWYVEIFADGLNRLNRNALSIIDCVEMRGRVSAFRFSRSGGSGNDPFSDTSGALAPGAIDVEPNDFTDDPRIDDIELEYYAEDCGSGGVATLLIDNNNIPNPLGSMRFTGRAVRCKHGKHTLIGAVNMATPYQIHVRADAIDCEIPFEILAGQGCTHEGGRNLRSKRAGLIGFTGFAAPQDFNRIDEIDQELGEIDSAGVQVRGWNGGKLSGGQTINAKTYGYQFLSNVLSPGGSPIRDITIEGVEAINRSNITSQSMSAMFYVDPSDGGPQIFPSTINERDVRYNGIPNSRWAVAGSLIKTIPGFGVWAKGQEIFADPVLEPGSPRVLRTAAANTSGAPFWFTQDRIEPVPAASLFGSLSLAFQFAPTNMRVETIEGGALRLTALAENATWIASTNFSTLTFNYHAPFSGTQTAYIGVWNGSGTLDQSTLQQGQWFYDTTGGVLGRTRGVVGGGSSGQIDDNLYGDNYRLNFTSGGTCNVQKLNAVNSVIATLFTTGTAGDGTTVRRHGVFIRIPGESLVIRGIART